MFLEEVTFPGGTRVLVWRLEEETSLLASRCHEMGIAFEDLMDLPLKRQREKAAERLLLCRAFGQPVTLLHDEQGAPSVEGHEQVNISITHTPQLVALAVNENEVIGLDAEQADRQQVLKVRAKFLNPEEQTFIGQNMAAHIIAWTAKEAIIKAERNSALDWTNGICLDPFTVTELDFEEITFTARCGANRYRMTTHRVEHHYMTLAIAY